MNKPVEEMKPIENMKLTEKDLRKKLGEYVAPVGLYDLNKSRPFVGKAVSYTHLTLPTICSV